MNNWVWFGLVCLAMLGGFILGSRWTGYMKSFVHSRAQTVVINPESNGSAKYAYDLYDLPDDGWPPGEVR